MKILLLFLILIAFESTRSASKASNFDRINKISTDFQTPSVLKNKDGDFSNFPIKDFTKLTIAFTYREVQVRRLAQLSRVLAATETPLFELSITQDDKTEKKLIELVTLVNDDKTVTQGVFTTNEAGSRTQAFTFEETTEIQRVTFSIDLQAGVISGNYMAGYAEKKDFYAVGSKDSLKYGALAFDETFKLTFTPEFQITDLVIEYDNYYSKDSLFQFMLVPRSTSLLSSYDLTKGSGFSIKDSVILNGLGTMYFGTNKKGTVLEDANINPIWTTDGLGFTKTTQYASASLGTNPFYGVRGDANNDIVSISSNFWIKLNENPITQQTIIRSKRSVGQDSFSVSLDEEGRVAVYIEGTLLSKSTDSLPVGEWTLLTVNIGVLYETNGVATIYFGNTLQTSELSFAKVELAKPGNQRRILADPIQYSIQLGGFIGEIRSLKFLGPGTVKINYPSNIEGCMIDFGFDSSVCATAICPNGETSFPCYETEDLKVAGDGDDDDDYDLSGGAIAGIVIGSVAFGVLLGAGIFFVVKGKAGKSGAKKAKTENRYRVPETPTESARTPKTTEV